MHPKPLKLDQIIAMYKSGATASRICLIFGLSERRYYELRKRHALAFQLVNKKRLMAQKKKSKALKELHVGPKVELTKSKDKISPEEKIAQLEKRLEREQKENAELKKLLDVANEFLGKL